MTIQDERKPGQGNVNPKIIEKVKLDQRARQKMETRAKEVARQRAEKAITAIEQGLGHPLDDLPPRAAHPRLREGTKMGSGRRDR